MLVNESRFRNRNQMASMIIQNPNSLHQEGERKTIKRLPESITEHYQAIENTDERNSTELRGHARDRDRSKS